MKTQEKEIQTATLALGSYTCNCLWAASVTKRVCIEQIEADIASAREALANGSAGIDKMRKKLNLSRGVMHPMLTRTKYLQLILQGEHGEAERRLREERATLIRVDTELRVLDEVIRRRRRPPLARRSRSDMLFRTRFHDGTSVVERPGKRGNSCLYDHGEREREEGTPDGEAMTVWVGRRGHCEVLHRETRGGR